MNVDSWIIFLGQHMNVLLVSPKVSGGCRNLYAWTQCFVFFRRCVLSYVQAVTSLLRHVFLYYFGFTTFDNIEQIKINRNTRHGGCQALISGRVKNEVQAR